MQRPSCLGHGFNRDMPLWLAIAVILVTIMRYPFGRFRRIRTAPRRAKEQLCFATNRITPRKAAYCRAFLALKIQFVIQAGYGSRAVFSAVFFFSFSRISQVRYDNQDFHSLFTTGCFRFRPGFIVFAIQRKVSKTLQIPKLLSARFRYASSRPYPCQAECSILH